MLELRLQQSLHTQARLRLLSSVATKVATGLNDVNEIAKEVAAKSRKAKRALAEAQQKEKVSFSQSLELDDDDAGDQFNIMPDSAAPAVALAPAPAAAPALAAAPDAAEPGIGSDDDLYGEEPIPQRCERDIESDPFDLLVLLNICLIH